VDKQTAKNLKKLFRSSITAPAQDQSQARIGGELRGRIPQDLLTEEMKTSGHTSLVLDNDESERYYRTFQLLRDEPELEYLSDKELKDHLWRFECEVFVNLIEYKRDLKKFNEKVDQFISALVKPFVEYEALIPIDYFRVGEHEIRLADCVIRHFTEEQLLEWGFAEHEIWRDSIHFYADKAAIVIRESGNDLEAVIHRARRRAEIVLHGLRVGFSNRDFTPERQLRFQLSSHTVLRDAEKRKIRRGTHVSPGPWQLDYFEEHDKDLVAFADDLLTKSASFKTEFKARIDRAIHWLGNAIEQEDYDQRVALICTAMESLLCSKSEGRKGEPLAYRMALLATLTGDSFMHPADVLWVYNLRSTVVHGSGIEVVGQAEYDRMLDAARGALKSYVVFIETNNPKDFAALVGQLESSPEAKQLLDWLNDHTDTEEIRELRKALGEAITGKERNVS
jgi:Apea-like HEPN